MTDDIKEFIENFTNELIRIIDIIDEKDGHASSLQGASSISLLDDEWDDEDFDEDYSDKWDEEEYNEDDWIDVGDD